MGGIAAGIFRDAVGKAQLFRSARNSGIFVSFRVIRGQISSLRPFVPTSRINIKWAASGLLPSNTIRRQHAANDHVIPHFQAHRPFLPRLAYNVRMNAEILARLVQIEKEENVEIFYACESGSRAWGFPSADSDYDVRFMYLHPRNWYLSIDVEEKRDVIERPINDELDISGWDLRKALKLLRKSNPPLLEWLSSPINYKETGSIAAQLRDAVAEFYSPVASYHHYLNMARNNYREYLKGDLVRVKKYFYVLRPLLAIRWIEAALGAVPMEFEKLVSATVDSPELKQTIADLIERKKSGAELDKQPKIPVISDFIESELERLKKSTKLEHRPKPNFERLNQLFRQAIQDTRKVK